MIRISVFAPLLAVVLFGSVFPSMAQQPTLADLARRLRAEKEQKARQEKRIAVYEGTLTLRAIPKFADAQNKSISQMEISVGNSSRRDYRYVFTARCGDWNKKISGNIKGEEAKAILVDVPSLCDWSTASLEDFREAEGLDGPEPQPSKVPGVDDAELARQSTVQRIVETSSPGNSVSATQAKVDAACKQQSLAEMAHTPAGSLGNHTTDCVKALDDLIAAARIQGEAQNKARAEAMNQPVAGGSVVIRLTGTSGLPFGGDCIFSSRAGGSSSKSYADTVPFQVTVTGVDTVICSFISKSDFSHDLKLEIIKDGRIIGESDTTAPYGLVSVHRDIN